MDYRLATTAPLLRPAIRKAVAAMIAAAVCAMPAAANNDKPRRDLPDYEFTPLTKEQADSLLPPELKAQLAEADTAAAPAATTAQRPRLVSSLLKRDNKFTRYLDGLISGNEDHSFDKPFDVNFVVMPSYTREGSFGIGGGATGLYRLDKTDSIMQPSDATLIANVTLNGLFSLRTNGNIHFPGRRLRLSYKLEYNYSPLDFWGVSREACGVNAKVSHTRNSLNWTSDLVYRIAREFNIGFAFDLVYSEITELDNWDYLDGQRPSYFFTGIGVMFQYDTRDFILQPTRGMNFVIRMTGRPQWLSSYSRSIGNLSIAYNYYLPLWRGSTLALDAYGSFNSMETPWPLREALGSGGVRMRGYYAGRYIDNNLLSVQAELRQSLFGRFGCAVWGGAGNVFSSIGNFRGRDILPTFGVGLRMEMKHNVNGRVDFGIGRGTTGFVFAIGEAF